MNDALGKNASAAATAAFAGGFDEGAFPPFGLTDLREGLVAWEVPEEEAE